MNALRTMIASWLCALIRLLDPSRKFVSEPSRTLVVHTTCENADRIEEVALERARACLGEDGTYTIVPGYTITPDVYMREFTGKFTAKVTVLEG
ncbi:hypothetical protein GCM10010402_52780 [Actinomadura luteofluorescens]|uniref:hypothetical protein n=1 Tax=Actinomadura luteofluorescens TaxID=46163 RepID=UPI002164907F|nr:hypothetical protein [Actinomadura glauciflava]MCR3744378.1 hypothetical protein [Actinomadura glauciflava]